MTRRCVIGIGILIVLSANLLSIPAQAQVGVEVPGLDGGNCNGTTIEDPYYYLGQVQARGVVDCNKTYSTITIHTCIQLLVPLLPDRGLFVQGPTCGLKTKEDDSHIEVVGRMPSPCIPGIYHATVEGVTTKGEFPNQERGPHPIHFSDTVVIFCKIADSENEAQNSEQGEPSSTEPTPETQPEPTP